jgi:hypothetical protein
MVVLRKWLKESSLYERGHVRNGEVEKSSQSVIQKHGRVYWLQGSVSSEKGLREPESRLWAP